MQSTQAFETEYGKLTLYRNDVYITGTFQSGHYWDLHKLVQLEPYLDPSRNILEIGGHCGTSTVVYASFLKANSKVYVYEPQKKLFRLLEHNIKTNGLEAKVSTYNKAVFCIVGSAAMNATDLDGGGGNVRMRYEDGKACNFGGIGLGTGGEPVELITIDTMPHENIGLVHIDAQGSENFILYGGREFIRRDRPLILFENNARYAAYHHESVRSAYPDREKEAAFDPVEYCVKELGYRYVIRRFGSAQSADDLLIP